MALNANQIPVYPITNKCGVANLNATSAGTMGSDTNGVTIATAHSAGTRINSLVASTTDTAQVNLFLYILDGATVIPLGIVNVLANSGNSATVYNVDLLDSANGLNGLPLDNTGRPYIDLKGSSLLKAVPLANMTAAKNCYVSWMGGDYA